MLAGDVLIIGSDGRDDIIIDRDENGLEVLNFDEDLFLESVEAGNGNLKEISLSIKAKGELNDDLSLLRVSFKELEVIKEEDRQKEEKEFLILLNQLEEKLEFQNVPARRSKSDTKYMDPFFKKYKIILYFNLG
jgi:hypothetical protein